jgi:hypothetical protein
MNYYDPFLAAWTLGPAGQDLAVESVNVTLAFNYVLEGTYRLFRVPVADVDVRRFASLHADQETELPAMVGFVGEEVEEHLVQPEPDARVPRGAGVFSELIGGEAAQNGFGGAPAFGECVLELDQGEPDLVLGRISAGEDAVEPERFGLEQMVQETPEGVPPAGGSPIHGARREGLDRGQHLHPAVGEVPVIFEVVHILHFRRPTRPVACPGAILVKARAGSRPRK